MCTAFAFDKENSEKQYNLSTRKRSYTINRQAALDPSKAGED